MSDSDAPLTQPQMRLMAYLDDELPPQERADFEKQLAEDASLAAEVAELQSLADMTKYLQVAEPADHEVRRFWESFYNRSEWQFGWVLFLGGVMILAVYGLYLLLFSELPLIVKAASVMALAGGSTLFWNTLRQKLRSHQLDRYRGVLH